ncbi:MAG TPA: lipopolysaccharide transport periplasmic protein LptA [Gammaproteobacteria bacterium]
MNLKLSLAAAALILLPVTPSAVALQSDANQPIEIEADLMTLDEQSGLSVYRGNVRLAQGSLRITAEELTLRMENGRLQRMEILGTETSPALFRQLTEAGEEAQGTARRIEYTALDSRMVLLGQAELLQGNNHIRSDRIDYNTERNSFVAGRPADSRPANGQVQPEERVRIIITPQQNR